MTSRKLETINRRTQILNLYDKGGSCIGIARKLNVSPQYVSSVCRKYRLPKTGVGV